MGKLRSLFSFCSTSKSQHSSSGSVSSFDRPRSSWNNSKLPPVVSDTDLESGDDLSEAPEHDRSHRSVDGVDRFGDGAESEDDVSSLPSPQQPRVASVNSDLDPETKKNVVAYQNLFTEASKDSNPIKLTDVAKQHANGEETLIQKRARELASQRINLRVGEDNAFEPVPQDDEYTSPRGGDNKDRFKSVRDIIKSSRGIAVIRPVTQRLDQSDMTDVFNGQEGESKNTDLDGLDVKERMRRLANAAGGGAYNPGMATAHFGDAIIQGFEEKRMSRMSKSLQPQAKPVLNRLSVNPLASKPPAASKPVASKPSETATKPAPVPSFVPRTSTTPLQEVQSLSPPPSPGRQTSMQRASLPPPRSPKLAQVPTKDTTTGSDVAEKPKLATQLSSSSAGSSASKRSSSTSNRPSSTSSRRKGRPSKNGKSARKPSRHERKKQQGRSRHSRSGDRSKSRSGDRSKSRSGDRSKSRSSRDQLKEQGSKKQLGPVAKENNPFVSKVNSSSASKGNSSSAPKGNSSSAPKGNLPSKSSSSKKPFAAPKVSESLRSRWPPLQANTATALSRDQFDQSASGQLVTMDRGLLGSSSGKKVALQSNSPMCTKAEDTTITVKRNPILSMKGARHTISSLKMRWESRVSTLQQARVKQNLPPSEALYPDKRGASVERKRVSMH